MSTIEEYQIQFRPKIGAGAWRIVERFNVCIMYSAFDALPDIARKIGYGEYQIVRISSNGSWRVPFTAQFMEV